jgi:hypothetical protein
MYVEQPNNKGSKTMKKLIAAMTFCLSASALAGGPNLVDSQKAGLNFSDLKAACQTPAKFHNQVAPANLQVSCKNQVLRWVALPSKQLSMPTSRIVTASLMSDKYTVSPVTAPVQSAAQVADCPQYKQVSETVETVRAISCADLMSFAGTSTDFCSTTINSLIDANHNAVQTQDTGKTVSFCAGSATAVEAESDLGGRSQASPAAQSGASAQTNLQQPAQAQQAQATHK